MRLLRRIFLSIIAIATGSIVVILLFFAIVASIFVRTVDYSKSNSPNQRYSVIVFYSLAGAMGENTTRVKVVDHSIPFYLSQREVLNADHLYRIEPRWIDNDSLELKHPKLSEPPYFVNKFNSLTISLQETSGGDVPGYELLPDIFSPPTGQRGED